MNFYWPLSKQAFFSVFECLLCFGVQIICSNRTFVILLFDLFALALVSQSHFTAIYGFVLFLSVGVSSAQKVNTYSNTLCCFGVFFLLVWKPMYRFPLHLDIHLWNYIATTKIVFFSTGLISYFRSGKKGNFLFLFLNTFHKFDWLDCANRTSISL